MNKVLHILLLFAPLVVPAGLGRIPLDQVPNSVRDVVKRQYPGARLLAASKQALGGKTLYAVGVDNKGQKLQVTLLPDGTLVATAREIAIHDLPAAVVRAVRTKYPRQGLQKAAEEKRGDKINYAVILDPGTGTPYEVVLDPEGRVLREGWRP